MGCLTDVLYTSKNDEKGAQMGLKKVKPDQFS
jgi:hypothetical protein